MEGTPAKYLGRIVNKDLFRTFIYSPLGSQKLVESWDEFEKEMGSGLWFATKDEAQNANLVEQEKPKKESKSKYKDG